MKFGRAVAPVMRKSVRVLVVLVVVAMGSLVWAGTSVAAGGSEQSADMIIGPYTIQPQPGGSDTNGLGLGELLNMKFDLNVQPPCQDCDITSITPDLTDANGNSVNLDSGLMLHHIVVLNPAISDVMCKDSPGSFRSLVGEPIFASGNERTAVPHAAGYGMYVPAGSRFTSTLDVMNFSTQPQTVEVRFHVTYVPGNTLRQVTPLGLDETGCYGFPPSYYSIPAGKSERTMTWTSTVTGKVLGAGGHVHPYGTHIEATDLTTNKVLCDSTATQQNMGGMPMITNMSTCVGAAPDYSIGEIHRGDRIQLKTYYDSPQAETLSVMGIMGFAIDQNG